MAVRPPIDQTAFDEHQTAAAERETTAAMDGLAQARQQQDTVRQQTAAAEQEDFTRDAQSQLNQALAPARRAQESVSFTQEAQDQVRALTRSVPTVESVSSSAAPQGTLPQRPAGGSATGLGRVYADARAAGLDDDGARAAVAVAATEGGMTGNVGDTDQNPLGSAGTFQLNFGGGQGNNYARSRGVSDQQARDELARDPHSGNAYALGGYLGAAIKAGQAKGLRGPALAEYAQRVGQVSVVPERAAANYASAQAGIESDRPPSEFEPPSAAARAPSRAEALGQFEQGLDYATAASICGPVAALAFVQANGRNPSLAEVRALAVKRGWTEAGGMNGVANEQALLQDLGVASRLDTSPDFGEIAADAASGNPVIISTGVHYYYANGYDPATGRLFVGKTGTSRRGGGSWMTAEQIANLDGGINGVLYVDNPQSPQPSVAASSGDTSGERPPSEFEQPSQFGPGAGRSVGGSFGAPIEPLPERGASVGGSFSPEDVIARRPPPGPDAGPLEHAWYAGGQLGLDVIEGGRRDTRILSEASAADLADPARSGRAAEAGANFAQNLAGEPLARVGRPVLGAAARAARPAVEEVAGGVARALPSLADIRDNYLKPLASYAERLYHETDPGRADEFLPLPGKFTRSAENEATYLANTPEMALGQGTNRGVLLEFDAGDIQGQVNTSKPMWQPAWEAGQAEFVGRLNEGAAYEQALRSVTVKPQVAGSKGDRVRLKNNLARLEEAGWTRAANPDGSVTWTRPDAVAPVEEAATGIGGAVRRFLGDQAGEVRLGGAPEPSRLMQQLAAGEKLPADEVLRRADEIDFISAEDAASTLRDAADTSGRAPAYLNAVQDFMLAQREKTLRGALTVRDVAKAYAMTLASIGSSEKSVEVAQKGLRRGQTIGPEFIGLNKRGAEAVRPEEQAAAWLFSPEGQRALDELERGVIDEDAWRSLIDARRAYGRSGLEVLREKFRVGGEKGSGINIPVSNLFSQPAKGTYNLRNIGEMTDALNAARGNPAVMNQVVQQAYGISSGKVGFVKSLLGFGDTPTMDAVELNFWLTGQGDISRLKTTQADAIRALKGNSGETGRRRKAGEVVEAEDELGGYLSDPRISEALREKLMGRINELRAMGLGADIDPSLAAHVMHHWIWDKAKGVTTTHEGMMRAQELAQINPALAARLGAGAAAGIDPQTDEQGNLTGVGYDPVRGAAGALGAGVVGSPTGRRAIRDVGAAARERGLVPGLGIEDVTRGPKAGEHVPDPSDTAAWLQYWKDKGTGAPKGPTSRQPMGLRAYEAFLRDQEIRAVEEGAARTRPTDPGDWASLLRSLDEAEPAGTISALGDLPGTAPTPATRRPTGRERVVPPGRTPPTPAQVPPELGSVEGVAQGRLGGPQTPPTPEEVMPGGPVGRQRTLAGFPRGEDPTSAPTSSHLFSRGWNRIRNVIEGQGAAGKELGGKLQEWRDTSERMQGRWAGMTPTVRKLSPKEFDQMVDVAEGKAAGAVSPKVQQAADEWDAVRREVFESSQAVDLPVGYRDDYFPHFFEPGTFRGKGFADAVTHLVQSGQAATREEAAADLRKVLAWRNRRYGNLEAERALDVPFYRRDAGVLYGQGGYLEGAADRISQVAAFGQKDAGAMALIDKIDQDRGTGEAVKGLFDAAVGARRDDPTAAMVSRGLRRANTVASLGLSAITNAGQTVNTATVAGFGPTAKAVWTYLRSPEAREDVVRAGVNLENVVRDIREGAGGAVGLRGKADKAVNLITAPGFGLVERFNRGVAYHAGGDVAEALLRRASTGDQRAAAELGRLGLDAETLLKRGYLTEPDRVTAGRRLVERSQFRVDPQDLPVWASTPAGKVVAQFKNFAYNQSAFMGREVLQPALRGDAGPLTRFLIAGLIAGAATTETRNVIQQREPEQDPAKRILQYYTAVGGLGLVGDVLRVTSPIVNINADRVDPDRVVTQAVGTVLGPTVGAGIEGLTGISQATRGNPTPLLRSGLRRIPVVGTTLQNLIVPYKPRTPASSAPAGRSSTAPPPPPKAPAPPKPPRPGR